MVGECKLWRTENLTDKVGNRSAVDVLGKKRSILYTYRLLDEGSYLITMLSRKNPRTEPTHQFLLSAEGKYIWLRETKPNDDVSYEFPIGEDEENYLDRSLWDLLEGRVLKRDIQGRIGREWRKNYPELDIP